MPKRSEVILYAEDNWNQETIMAVISGKQSIAEYAFILHDRDMDEDGKVKKPHYHLYLGFGKTNCTFDRVAKWFGTRESSVAKIRSTKLLTLKYFLHEGHPDKYQYPLGDMIASFDVNKYFEAHSRAASVNKLIESCAAGIITPENYPEHIAPTIYAVHEQKFLRAWRYRDRQQDRAADGQRDCAIIWVHGPSGTGKTTVCRLTAQSQAKEAYVSATGKDPFSHYADEPIVILDDLRPNVAFNYSELLKILDPHFSCAVHSRYRNKRLRCSMIFITSIFSPVDFIIQHHLASQESDIQLFRRLSEVWEVSKDAIRISKYNLDKQAFEHTNTLVNPVPAYLAQFSPAAPFDGAALINRLLDS